MGAGTEERQAALSAICREDGRESAHGRLNNRAAVWECLSGRLSSSCEAGASSRRRPSLTARGLAEDEIRFTHHLLHDYAIAQSLIPKSPQLFCDYAIRQALLPIFYRQSFLFALEELWDVDEHRAAFWESALRLEGAQKLHGLARILAPIIAARRVEITW